MAAQEIKKPLINLLPQEEFAASTLGRILKWLTSTFRIIVIMTEVVVMLAFLSRFYFDARSNDLTDQINQKKAVISSFANLEKDFKTAQSQLKIFAALTTDNKKFLPLMQTLATRLPANVQLTFLTFTNGELEIRANSLDEAGAAQTIANLQDSKLFKSVNLTQVESKQTDSFISFNVKGVLANAK
jgi:Tfp pilus assembly protein PilN